MKRCFFLLRGVLTLLVLGMLVTSAWASDALMDRMADFDPSNPVVPKGDTIKIGHLNPFSGPAAMNGELYHIALHWVAHDLNKQGGVMVDGKLKKIEIIKGDTMSKPINAKKAAERLILGDKVDLLWGSTGSHISLVCQQTAAKYKKIYVSALSISDSLMDAENFNRYTFHTPWTTSQAAKSLAYFYAKRPEKKFYILCQDYSFGHALAEKFKGYLKEFRPDAEIVGEDYHPLFTKDFAPYLEKIKASGAEVIFSGDWMPDSVNLLKQSRDSGLNLPFANMYMDDPITLGVVGVEGSAGLVNANQYMINDMDPRTRELNKVWNHLHDSKWEEPYNSSLYVWPLGVVASAINTTYWMMDVVERAGSTDPEKIIATWEGDKYNSFAGVLEMRACDHVTVRDTYVSEFSHPAKWFDNFSYIDKIVTVPSYVVEPPLPEGLDRCKK
ncbi:amino acid/amide ABC transporter substrate-binding protein, HAAT family [Desulfatibacillum alkenivorans DSM 16219]|uniref:Amino acid/amide ABC transporter substrate-binding protein, HAAT family n=1 Tax=Desulfatibacillum alkenivorans DSM 16219 TaxID=1121393 RepID=A0A1M7ADL9_9BACT|nr:ABC transporter substrate-binding protein [Desulfatibacillum alkenivorans]SHL40804.1 amino acid/amide ABC transporter substrate-binding protein, HAAT family [Desulfatibacillum alkenivorans DSM 16219]